MDDSYFKVRDKSFKIPQVVSVPNTLYQSLKGRYFVGQTIFLFTGKGQNAWAALVNPKDSDVNLYVNVITISNFSSIPYTAQTWLNTNPPASPAIAERISPANTTIDPLPKPKVELQYVQSTTLEPSGGVNTFNRVVNSNNTLVSEEDGKFIIPPGGNYLIFLISEGDEMIKSKVAFGWWEKHLY